MSEFVNVPPITITKDLIERIQFSLSSRNSENKVAECAVHVFASKFVESLQEIQWQYVASGVPCMLRNRELHKNGRRYMWSMSMCLYNAHYGVLVWKSKLSPNCEYTTVADNFHVFALSEVNVIVGLLFSSKEQACELSTLYNTWHQERQRDDGKKGPAAAASPQQPRFRKEMISKPCNFQHIQGTQALDECLEIEKIKADIIAALFGLGTTVGRNEPDGQAAASKRKGSQSKRSKHEITKPKMSFKMLSIPQTSLNTPPTSPPLSPLATTSEASNAHESLHTAHAVQFQATVDVTNGYQENNQVFIPPEANQVFIPPQSPTAYVPEASYPATEAMYPHNETSYPPAYSPDETSYPPTEPADETSYPPTEPSFQPDIVTTNFVEAGTGEFIQNDSAHNSQGSQPNMYNQVNQETDRDYDRLEPSTGIQYNTSQGSFGYSQSPPRLDLNLEKEFSESVLFQSPLMTAN